MSELYQTIIEIPKFTLFIPTEERPIHRIVLGTHRCRIVDIGDDAVLHQQIAVGVHGVAGVAGDDVGCIFHQ